MEWFLFPGIDTNLKVGRVEFIRPNNIIFTDKRQCDLLTDFIYYNMQIIVA